MNKFKKFFLSLSTIAFILTLTTSELTLANNSLTIEQQAEQLYRQNNKSAAIKLLQQAIANYRKQKDGSSIAIANRNLALVYQDLGEWQQATDALLAAEKAIANIKNRAIKQQLLAQILEVRGQIALSLGHSQTALDTWKKVAFLYEEQNNPIGYTRAKIYQASALQGLGLYSQAIKNLTKIQNQLENAPDSKMKVRALQNTGNVLTRTGKYTESAAILKSSLKIAKQLKEDILIAETLLSLGNNSRLQGLSAEALEFYQQAIELSPNSELDTRARLARLQVLIDTEETTTATTEVAKIKRTLLQLPIRQTTVREKVSLARYLMALDTKPSQIIPLLVDAIREAQKLQNKRVEADALGVLGNLYEQNQQLLEAEKITTRALLIAQNINAKELIYQEQWQLGRILKARGQTESAIEAYTQATAHLQALRSDLVAISSDVQYSFTEKIEPVYRELAALLLRPGASQADLEQARQIIESLQVAELDNFFRDACLDTVPVEIDTIDRNAAIFYTIILENRLEVIAAIPDRPLQHYTHELRPSELEIVVTSANSQISSPRRFNLQLLQQGYDWLIRPVETDLAEGNLTTLVFVLDGLLRNLPPATLHDGERYAIEKYNIAIAPGLQLTQLQSEERNRQEALLAGLSESRQGFTSLPGVRQEIQQIEPLLPSKVLFNNSFTELNFNRSTNQNPYRIVHLATHGQFSSDADDTFILTWDGRIDITELNELIRGDTQQLRPVDLLVLSACETASGDRNSVLGLAGIAVRGGAKSTLASLWAVSDRATVELMTNFYRELNKENTTKAEALRQAQLSLLKSDFFAHPYFWSAFILVGNWQ